MEAPEGARLRRHRPRGVVIGRATANDRLSSSIIQAASMPAGFEAGRFDVCVRSDVIEHSAIRSPACALIRTCWRPAAPSSSRRPHSTPGPRRLLGRSWMEYKAEHLFYFNRQTIQSALHQTGFHQAIVGPGWKVLNARLHRAAISTAIPVPSHAVSAGSITRLAPTRPARRGSRSWRAESRDCATGDDPTSPATLRHSCPPSTRHATFRHADGPLLAKANPRPGHRDRHRREQLDRRHPGGRRCASATIRA